MSPARAGCFRFLLAIACGSIAYADAPRSSPTPSIAKTPPRVQYTPRLKASYRLFSIANLDGSSVWLNGAQLDVYAISRRWIRIGLELGGGTGRATFAREGAQLRYGMSGVSVGIQYPWRVTPFLEGRFAAGVLAGSLDRAMTIAGVTVNDPSAVTWMYGGGIETGVEVYAWKRAYLSVAVGWVRTTWRGIDYSAFVADPTGSVPYRDLVGDSVTFKLGGGI